MMMTMRESSSARRRHGDVRWARSLGILIVGGVSLLSCVPADPDSRSSHAERSAATPEPTPEPEPAPAPEPEPVAELAAQPEPAEPEPAPPEPIPAELADRSPLLIVHAGMLILDPEAAPNWARGRISEPPGNRDNYRASKPIVLAAIPDRHLAQRERSFDVYDRDEKLCTAKLGELRVIAQYGGPDVDDLYDLLDYSNGSPQITPSKTELLAKVWETQPHWLVAELIPDGDCRLDDALWARDAQLPAPLLLTPSKDENAVTRERARQFEASTELAKKQADYQAWYDALAPEERAQQPDWAQLAQEWPLEISSWLDLQGRPQLIELRFGVGPGCDDFFDSTITAFEQVTSGGLVPTGHEIRPAAVFDADLDGSYEFFYHTGVDTGSVRSKTLSVEVEINADLNCAC
jgi:hypothetical protein